jgi:hypothetical protein
MVRILFIILLLFAQTFTYSSSKDTVKVKIAILHKAGDEITSLRSKDRLKAGEMIRIFILPLNNCYVYVVHSDNKESVLLYGDKVKGIKDTLILPSLSEYYIFDDQSPTAKITILCSLDKITDIEKLFDNKESSSLTGWNKVEVKLIKESKKELSEVSDKPFPIAGNVSAVNEDFIEQILTFEGNKLLIRKYELEIKK